jgi:glycosyltransferase involved in cell wall biosynthesis
MANSDRVLFITYSFPPDVQVGGKRVARLSRYLPEYGIRPVVLTAQERFYESTDSSYAVPEGIELVRTRINPTLIDWYRARRLKGKQTSAPGEQDTGGGNTHGPSAVRRILRPFVENISALLEVPNHNPGWYKPAVEAGTKLLQQAEFTAVVSSGPPWTCHEVARTLKRRFGIPWIADFRDAWTFNPWRPKLPKWRDKLDDRSERSIVREADRVVSVVDMISEEFRSTYPEVRPEKFVTITNGFEGELRFDSDSPANNQQKTILHLGSLYCDRRIENFCRAVEKLIQTGRMSSESVQIIFVGPIAAEYRSRAERETPDLFEKKVIQFRHRVPYAEGQQMLRSADVLLLLLGDNRHVITAKFYEYIASPKPLMVVAKQGALSRLTNELHVGVCADPEDVDAIAEQLIRALGMPPRTALELGVIAARFHFRNLARCMAGLILEVAGER